MCAEAHENAPPMNINYVSDQKTSSDVDFTLHVSLD